MFIFGNVKLTPSLPYEGIVVYCGDMVDDRSPDGSEMLFRIRVSRLHDGERLPLVVRPDGLPLPLPNQWALFIRRPHVQSNTLIEEMRTVADVYDWATRRGYHRRPSPLVAGIRTQCVPRRTAREVHTTPHGQCASNIAESPCATAVSCLGGCRH